MNIKQFSQINGDSKAFKAGQKLAEEKPGVNNEDLKKACEDLGFSDDEWTDFVFGYNSIDKKAENFGEEGKEAVKQNSVRTPHDFDKLLSSIKEDNEENGLIVSDLAWETSGESLVLTAKYTGKYYYKRDEQGFKDYIKNTYDVDLKNKRVEIQPISLNTVRIAIYFLDTRYPKPTIKQHSSSASNDIVESIRNEFELHPIYVHSELAKGNDDGIYFTVRLKDGSDEDFINAEVINGDDNETIILVADSVRNIEKGKYKKAVVSNDPALIASKIIELGTEVLDIKSDYKVGNNKIKYYNISQNSTKPTIKHVRHFSRKPVKTYKVKQFK